MLGERGGNDDDVYAGRRNVKNVRGVVGQVASKLRQILENGFPTPPRGAGARRSVAGLIYYSVVTNLG